ncbi:MAG: pentapeptide repeat-containing protein, partial [Anaerolineae bacterium]|nr:pentapeptide repeat-containing protein [Anaerolineae bacterium]
ADLLGADLTMANLFQADMAYANLGNATLINSNLRDVCLEGANLCGANLEGALFSSKTCLPDTPANMTDGIAYYDPAKGIVQMERYTNPDHPDFWQPDWVKNQAE